MSEFEAELRNSLKSISTQVNILSKGLDAVKSSVSESGQQLKRRFHEARGEAENLNHEIYETGHALKGLTGIFGELSHVLTGGFRFEGGLATIAVSAAAAGFAFNTFKEILKGVAEEELKTFEVTQKLGEAIYTASRRAEHAKLSLGESQIDDTKRLVARTGEQGLEQARGLAGGHNGITLQEAIRGVSSAALINNPRARERAIEVARRIAVIGEGKFDETINNISGNRGILGSLAGSGDIHDSVERQILNNQGRAPTKANRRSATREYLRSDLDTIRESNFITQIGQAPAINASEDLASGALGLTKTEEVKDTLDPRRESARDLIFETNAQIERLRAESTTLLTQIKDALIHSVNRLTLPSENYDYQTTTGNINKAFDDRSEALKAAGVTNSPFGAK
jgi:hypothetical protein